MGYPGHFTFECRNFVKLDQQKELVLDISSCSSDSEDEADTPIAALRRYEMKKKLEKEKKLAKKAKKDKKKKKKKDRKRSRSREGRSKNRRDAASFFTGDKEGAAPVVISSEEDRSRSRDRFGRMRRRKGEAGASIEEKTEVEARIGKRER